MSFVKFFFFLLLSNSQTVRVQYAEEMHQTISAAAAAKDAKRNVFLSTQQNVIM